MTAIVGFAEILDERLDDARDREHLAIIRRNGSHLIDLINDVLDLSKVEAGRLELERKPFSPQRLLEEVIELLEVRAKGRGIDLLLEVESGLPELITGDPTRMRQVLINIIGNAIKFTPQGHVRCRAMLIEGEPTQLSLVIEDTGIGMTQEVMNRVFDAFSQADASTTRKFGGTGLGLALCRKLVELMGGRIAFSSMPDEGSSFRIQVPIEIAQGEWQPKKRAARTGNDGSALDARVLVAEDGIDNQILFELILSKAGADVSIAENGAEAIEAIAPSGEITDQFDVVLMDMQMPEMDGYTATRRLREMGYDGPIIALTAHAMEGDEARCLEAGCDAYLSKPVDRQRLVALCRNYSPRNNS